MNILFDTNILILLNQQPVNSRFACMLRTISELSWHIFVHPLQKRDFERDSDVDRRIINLSMFNRFEVLLDPPIPTDNEIKNLGWIQKNDHDQVDNQLLFCVKEDVVHLLVSEDKGIHKKAKHVNISEQVHFIDQFISFLEEFKRPKFNVPVGIELKKVYQLNKNSSFWDSLCKTYPNFNSWLVKISKEQRECWCVVKPSLSSKSSIIEPLAVCIFKVEENTSFPTYSDLYLEGKILKLCTFKISEDYRGHKIGERLLYTAFSYAVRNKLSYVYLHTRKQDKLVQLCEEYGFVKQGRYKEDDVLVKKMIPPTGEVLKNLDPLKFNHSFYPYFIDDENVQKFLVPIKREYHEMLFPDVSNYVDSLFPNDLVCSNPQSNTIKKVYLSHSNINSIKPGDLLLFYRSHDRKTIEVIGVVEQAIRTCDYNRVSALISKRSVYSPEEIKKILNKSTLVILFRLVKYLNPISVETINQAGIKGSIQSIRKIPNRAYRSIMGK